jgi:rhamnulose-1-phosphate aldolase
MPEHPAYTLDEILRAIGEAGQRLSDIDASEGAAGNISVYVAERLDVRVAFPIAEIIELPVVAPELAGGMLIVTGSGRRLRDIASDPLASLGCLVVDPDGKTGQLFSSPKRIYRRLTSELNSHLAVQRTHVRPETALHTVIHAQPIHLVYLSHIARYQDPRYLNTRLLRWQPELIVNLPQGIALVPFHVPGSPELMAETVAALQRRHFVLWTKHGVMARAEGSVKHACDRIEYAETAARYEQMNLMNGELAEGLSVEQIREICRTYGIVQDIF